MRDFDLEQQLIDARRRRYGEQAQAQAPQGRMVGGRFVAPHALEYLAAGLRGFGGIRGEQMAEDELRQLQTTRQQAVADALRGFNENMQGRPAEVLPPDVAGPPQPAQPQNIPAAYQALMQAPDPSLRQMGMQGITRLPELQAQREERQAQRDFQRQQAELQNQQRIEQLQTQQQMRLEAMREQNASREQMAQAQREFQAQLARENRAFQANMANLQSSLRPEKNVTVLGPNGEAITLPQSQAQGMPLYNPQSAASLQKERTKTQAKEQLSTVINQLSNSYDALEKGGGITSTQQGALSNIAARLSSSGVGQAVGGAVGTENQRQRQEIAQTRPLLMNLIKEATGMSAQQMNSNAEMMLYLQAATDPTLSIEANRSALANLDRLFGLGLAKPPKDRMPAPDTTGGGRALSAQDQQALDWANANPNDPRSAKIKTRLGVQ
jgi:hypothetical protein